ncbi:MAG: hypothetical protein H7X99_04545 [Saprospiraceae bacterium]|nr:hypothetical protein [Saprospiraceae bacterium]
MKTKLILITLLCSFNTYCQMRLGVVGSFSTIQTDPHVRDLATSDGRLAYNFGFVKQENHYSYGIGLFKNFGNLFLLTEGNYRENLKTFSLQNYLEGESERKLISETTKTIQIPVAAGIDLGFLRLGAGPTFEFLLDETQNVVKHQLFQRKERKINYGFQFLLGLDLNKHLMMNIKFEQEFAKIGDQYYFNNQNSRITSKLNRLTVGFGIFM